MASKVVITRALPSVEKELKDEGFEVVMYGEEFTAAPHDWIMENCAGAKGILCFLTDRIDEEVVKQAGDSLKTICTVSVGFDHIDLDCCKERNIRVGNVAGICETTAELAFSLILNVVRGIPNAHARLRNGEVKDWSLYDMCGDGLRDVTVGIIGLGDIGLAVGRMLKVFGCKMYYFDVVEKPAAAEIGASFVPNLDDIYAKCNAFTVHVPLNRHTRHMFNYETFKKMGEAVEDSSVKHTYFVNTARGEVVDQEGLLRALEEGIITRAGLDVTYPEPLPSDHPLLNHQNCYILPHIGSATMSARDEYLNTARENLKAALSETYMPHEVRL